MPCAIVPGPNILPLAQVRLTPSISIGPFDERSCTTVGPQGARPGPTIDPRGRLACKPARPCRSIPWTHEATYRHPPPCHPLPPLPLPPSPRCREGQVGRLGRLGRLVRCPRVGQRWCAWPPRWRRCQRSRAKDGVFLSPPPGPPPSPDRAGVRWLVPWRDQRGAEPHRRSAMRVPDAMSRCHMIPQWAHTRRRHTSLHGGGSGPSKFPHCGQSCVGGMSTYGGQSTCTGRQVVHVSTKPLRAGTVEGT